MHLFTRGALISIARFGEKALAFAIVIIASRFLGNDGIGEFFFYFSLACLFMPLMDMGFEKLLLQQWWEQTLEGRRRFIGQLLMIKLATGLVALVCIIVLDQIVNSAMPKPLACISSFLAIYIASIGDLLRQPAHALNIIKYDLMVPLATRLVTLGVFLLLAGKIHAGMDLLMVYALSSIVGTGISLLGMGGCSPSYPRGTSLGQFYQIFKAGIPFSMTHLFVMVSLYVDTIFLGYFCDMSMVGDYNAAYRLILAIIGLGGGVCYAIFPLMTNLREQEKGKQAFELVMKAFLVLFGTCTLGGIFLGPDIMTHIYGEKFKHAGVAFQILSPLVLIASITNLVGQSLEAAGRQKVVMGINLKSSLFNVLANLAVIPWLGMIGASITTIATEIIVMFFQNRHTSATDCKGFRWSVNRRPILFLGIVAAGYSLLPFFGEWLALRLEVSALRVWGAFALGCLIFVIAFVPFRRYWLHLNEEARHENIDG